MCINKASRERFLYWYEEHASADTDNFIKKRIHPIYEFCIREDIYHHKIQTKIPRKLKGAIEIIIKDFTLL